MARNLRTLETAPDLILLASSILNSGSDLPRSQAVALKDGLILAVGPGRETLSLAGPSTSVMGYPGKCIAAGFHDAHIHLVASAAKRLSVDCSAPSVTSICEIQEAIRERVRSVPPGTWIRAGNYDEFRLAEKRHPTRWDLDAVAPDHPVKLQHRSLHACVLNSLALHFAGLSGETSPPSGAKIDLDPSSHEPTGLVYECDDYLTSRVIPPLDEHDLRLSLRHVLRDLLAFGLTTVHDATYRNGLAEWERLHDLCSESWLRPRIGFMPGIQNIEGFRERGMGFGFGNRWLNIGAVKLMLTEAAGDFCPSVKELREEVSKAHEYGYPVAIHAIEESAVCVAADCLATVATVQGKLPDRIEHCSVLPPPLIERLSELGVTVITQPGFLFYSGDRYLANVEEHLHDWLYPIRSFLERGIVVGAGSDAPVSSANPLDGIYAAATRLSQSGHGIATRERVTAEQALGLYTSGAAQCCGEYSWKGSVEPGKAADLVLLSDDLTTIEPHRIRGVEVEMTIVGGKIAWQKGDGGAV